MSVQLSFLEAIWLMYCNRLNTEAYIRIQLSSIKSDIKELCRKAKQPCASQWFCVCANQGPKKAHTLHFSGEALKSLFTRNSSSPVLHARHPLMELVHLSSYILLSGTTSLSWIDAFSRDLRWGVADKASSPCQAARGSVLPSRLYTYIQPLFQASSRQRTAVWSCSDKVNPNTPSGNCPQLGPRGPTAPEGIKLPGVEHLD